MVTQNKKGEAGSDFVKIDGRVSIGKSRRQLNKTLTELDIGKIKSSDNWDLLVN